MNNTQLQHPHLSYKSEILQEVKMLYGEITARYWNEIRRSAKRRKIAFLLTPEEAWGKFLMQNRCCAFSRILLDFTSQGYRGTASLDRLDNRKPYTCDNIQWVLTALNLMRGGNNIRYFKKLCRLVAFPADNQGKSLWELAG